MIMAESWRGQGRCKSLQDRLTGSGAGSCVKKREIEDESMPSKSHLRFRLTNS